MTETFAKAPLVEIVADLRWPDSSADQVALAKGVPFSLIDGKSEGFMTRFGEAAYSLGFNRSERLIPSGFPVPHGSPVYRHRPSPDSQALMRSSLLQVGPSLFSANAVPPYKSWDEFMPVVQSGVAALLGARDEAEKALPFTHVSLRYIDAFVGDLLVGHDVQSFIRDVLGFKLDLPTALREQQGKADPAKVHLQLQVPLERGMTMHLVLGSGTFNGQDAVMMNTQVVANTEIAPDLDAVMQTLSTARQVIHSSFIGMTASIRDVMLPQGA